MFERKLILLKHWGNCHLFKDLTKMRAKCQTACEPVKEDGSQAQQGEELEFKVIEFVKETKRIILSHSRTFEEDKEEARRAAKRASKKKEEPVVNNVAASTTLGDLDALAELKAKMEKGE